ncbi:putative Sugar phosphatase YidA [Candidatus Hydrogenisulfobacillus filiaventi]|uniref:Putative Sugar phosphatase YidA n=1 Tax=Candidatus Hydrogenisulfobacillus filiaventi TaxID=2707344 RepID=A0A6F8ZID2_9FIRM|nr:Cof-type HAD-IIB family hydrolase [Bacillota bacterium]CAB1129348.1 putative Sugar phosphatase YidA [Candidatus Hydrogenisulfobacillus filiaventi]
MREQVKAVRVELLALDLDGTAAGYDGRVSPRVLAAVHAARRQGVTVVLASGRMLASVRPFWRQFGLGAGYCIAYNGAMVAAMPEARPVLEAHLPSDPARRLAQAAVGAGLVVQAYVGDELWISEDDARAREYIAVNRIPGRLMPPPALWGWPTPPIKLLLQGDDDALAGYRAEAEPVAAAAGLRVVRSHPHYLEILPGGAGKGEALAAVAARLGIPARAVLAIGDAENDLDMIRWAGIGVAMGQALPAVRAAADWVAPPVEADGAAVAIERWAL